jgi:Flp pilus assembly protein TadG
MRNLMLRLARPVLRLLGREERGAVGVIIAVLISAGVLLGMGALVIDVGQLYQNRAELQNGADAGALGVAKSCVLTTCTNASAMTTATGFADANASNLTGDKAAVNVVCGSGNLGACPASTGAMTDCPSVPTSGVNYVDVHTSTLTPNGTVIPPVFARTLLGNSSYEGATVYACAQAEWGPAAESNTLAMTLSICSWTGLTGGNSFGPDVAIIVHGSAPSCKGPAGQTYPGGFDWLCPNSASGIGGNCNSNPTCQSQVTLSGSPPYLYYASTSTGNRPPPPCNTELLQLLDTVVFIPVFDSAINTSGHNTEYEIIGLAAFKITGWKNLSTVSPKSSDPGDGVASQCPGNDACIYGEFTQALVPVSGGISTGPNLGAEVIKLSG